MIGDTDTSIIATTKPPFTPKTYTTISSIKDVPDEIVLKSAPQEYEIKFHNPPKEIFTLSKIVSISHVPFMVSELRKAIESLTKVVVILLLQTCYDL
jgi:hypothetical protein